MTTRAEIEADALSDAEFREHMRPLSSALGKYAKAMAAQPELHRNLPSHDSRAMAELAAQSQWAIAEWNEPARNAHSYGSMLAYFVAEHLAAYAAIIDGASVGPRFAHLATARTIFETAPIARWLLEPRIPLDKRIKRSIVYRLKSANELGRMQHEPRLVSQSQLNRERCARYIEAQGWLVKGLELGGESLPAGKTEFSKVAFGASFVELDRTLWAIMSGAQHGSWYALADGLRAERLEVDPLDPTGMVAPLMVTSENLTMFGIMCWHGCSAVATARSELMGWSSSTEMIASGEAIEAIARDFVQHRRSKSSSPDAAL
ncbi:MAG: hypothetical protein JWN62_1357 [Acidimicrobiales bacterium]|nr:hypothetical protein [Acidimicrobiales bacterium]